MDFRLGERSEELRQEARDFLDEVLTDEVRQEMERTGVHSTVQIDSKPACSAAWARHTAWAGSAKAPMLAKATPNCIGSIPCASPIPPAPSARSA
jgi:hypothetical protein